MVLCPPSLPNPSESAARMVQGAGSHAWGTYLPRHPAPPRALGTCPRGWGVGYLGGGRYPRGRPGLSVVRGAGRRSLSALCRVVRCRGPYQAPVASSPPHGPVPARRQPPGHAVLDRLLLGCGRVVLHFGRCATADCTDAMLRLGPLAGVARGRSGGTARRGLDAGGRGTRAPSGFRVSWFLQTARVG